MRADGNNRMSKHRVLRFWGTLTGVILVIWILRAASTALVPLVMSLFIIVGRYRQQPIHLNARLGVVNGDGIGFLFRPQEQPGQGRGHFDGAPGRVPGPSA